MDEVDEPGLLFERVTALDLSKAELTACVRIPNPHKPGYPDRRFADLGSDYYQTKINTKGKERNLVRQLEALTGQKVTLQPAA